MLSIPHHFPLLDALHLQYQEFLSSIHRTYLEFAQWLEVAQFQTEDLAQKFKADFISLTGSKEFDHVTGPALAGVIADGLGMESRWQIMDQPALEKLKVGDWSIKHPTSEWKPLKPTAEHDIQGLSPDMSL